MLRRGQVDEWLAGEKEGIYTEGAESAEDTEKSGEREEEKRYRMS